MNQAIQSLTDFFKGFSEEELVRICLAMDKKNNYLLGFCFERFIQQKMHDNGINLSIGWYKVYSKKDKHMRKPLFIVHLCPSYTPYEGMVGKMFEKIYPRIPVYHITYNPLDISEGIIKVIYNDRVLDLFPFGGEIVSFTKECTKALYDTNVNYGKLEQKAVEYLHLAGNITCDYCIESLIMSFLFGDYKLINIDGIASVSSFTGKKSDEGQFVVLEMKNKTILKDKSFWVNAGEARGLNEFWQKGVRVLIVTSIDDVNETYRKIFERKGNEINLLCYPVDRDLTTFPTTMSNIDKKYGNAFTVYKINYSYFIKFSNFREIYDENIKRVVKRHYDTLQQYTFGKNGPECSMIKLLTLLHLYHMDYEVDLPYALEMVQNGTKSPILNLTPTSSTYVLYITRESSFLVYPKSKAIMPYFDENDDSASVCIIQHIDGSMFDDFTIIGFVRKQEFLKEMVPVITTSSFIRMNTFYSARNKKNSRTIVENIAVAKKFNAFCALEFRHRYSDGRVWFTSCVEPVKKKVS